MWFAFGVEVKKLQDSVIAAQNVRQRHRGVLKSLGREAFEIALGHEDLPKNSASTAGGRLLLEETLKVGARKRVQLTTTEYKGRARIANYWNESLALPATSDSL